jgi:hypothetical protein
MAHENEPVNTLAAAQNRLIEERRALAVAMALGHRRRRADDSYANDMREAFIGVQNTIEAINCAIEHETRIASGQPAVNTDLLRAD